MKINSINNQIRFCGNNQEAQTSGFQSSLRTTAINGITGAAVGAGIGGVGCLMPVSKKSVEAKLCDALALYKKDEFPIASEIQKLTKQLTTATKNNETLDFIQQVKNMGDDEFAKSASKLSKILGASADSSKDDIIRIAESKLIGKNPKITGEAVLKETGEKLLEAQGKLLEGAKKFLSDNPKDELVQFAKKAAKSARNSKLLKSSIRFGFMAAMLLGVFQAINSKSSKEQ